MKGFILALQFFTRIPISVNIEFSHSNLKKAFFFLPIIGGLIGYIVSMPFYSATIKYADFSAAVSLILYLFLTGGLHIDGLADTADGFFSARSEKGKILEIMNDSNIGAYGALSIFMCLLLRFIALKMILLQYLTIQPSGKIYFLNPHFILIFAGIISRTAGLSAVVFSKPAKETGLGALFHKTVSSRIFYFWLIFIVALCFFPVAFSSFSIHNLKCNAKEILSRMRLLIIPAVSFLTTLFIIKTSYKKIGGTTGDVNGCIIEIVEILILNLVNFIFGY